MFKVLTVCGTRPDTIKMAPIINELKKYPEKVELIEVVTGQHKEMLEQVLKAFSLQPKYNLNIMAQKQTLSSITVKILNGLEELIALHQPNLIIAQGDTSTTFAASLSAFYHKIPFAHIEAGLRTNNKYDPYPEEMNRRITGLLAELHFAPTEMSRNNLLRENVDPKNIFVTGNTVIDALLYIAGQDYRFADEKLNELIKSKKIILLTTHRRENWGEPMKNICTAVKRIVKDFPEYAVVFPVHKNPIVREVVYPEFDGVENVYLTEPFDYVPFVHMQKVSHLILTDSGGVQEEAPSLGVPVIVLRKTTERPEGVKAGNSRLIGTDPDKIYETVKELTENREAYEKMSKTANPYGTGNSAEQTVKIIFDRFGV
ncbi:MAG: UDP-N-acetylglucosamine 2-epimerase (non-hydrolyzing) [Armatimonadetes bacterium]|nr:UDP-N-acetylglucosamine 2-epimerase (non-hydrolyzing) [Candidatus Hippobium faecium]